MRAVRVLWWFSALSVLMDEPKLHLFDDVLVVGYDDVPQAAWSSYRLTTVAQPAHLIV